jgi:hypothetical protein
MAYDRRQFHDLAIGDSFRLVPSDDAVELVRTGKRSALRLSDRVSETLRPTEGVFVYVPDPTPEQLLAQRIEGFTYTLDHMIATSQATLDEWRAKLDKDPLYAFEWADRAFEAAAQFSVATRVRTMLTTMTETTFGEAFENVIEMLRDETLRGAKYPQRSTSPSSNHAAQVRLAVYATLVDQFAAKK